MTAVQLKALCKEQGLKVSGKKAELQGRLREHFLIASDTSEDEDEFENMPDEDLVQSLVARGLNTSGSRKDRLERIRADIRFAQEVETAAPPDGAQGYRTIGEALEAAAQNGGAMGDILAEIKAKAAEKPKSVDVTIKSLGMKPEKETNGGAASVTADVLRGLAGDPFEDPPKYGSVRLMITLCTADAILALCFLLTFLTCPRPTIFSVGVKKGTKPASRSSVCAPSVRLIR